MGYTLYNSPVGNLHIYTHEGSLVYLNFSEIVMKPNDIFIDTPSNDNVAEAVMTQLTLYFEGNLKIFDIPLAPVGSDFQKRVWQQLLTIPYGSTTDYLSMAMALGDKKCIRAAAGANGKNPVAIVIPCHRVIGKNGSLTGYAGGLERKDYLLNHEAKVNGTYMELF